MTHEHLFGVVGTFVLLLLLDPLFDALGYRNMMQEAPQPESSSSSATSAASCARVFACGACRVALTPAPAQQRAYGATA